MATFLINKCFIVDVSSLSEHFLSKISILKEEEEKQTFPDRSECKYALSADSRHVMEEYSNRKSIRMGDTEK